MFSFTVSFHPSGSSKRSLAQPNRYVFPTPAPKNKHKQHNKYYQNGTVLPRIPPMLTNYALSTPSKTNKLLLTHFRRRTTGTRSV